MDDFIYTIYLVTPNGGLVKPARAQSKAWGRKREGLVEKRRKSLEKIANAKITNQIPSWELTYPLKSPF